MISVNPNMIRLIKTKTWASKYIENKSNEFSLNMSQDLEIRKFVIIFFKKYGLNIHTCKINYFNNSLIIFVSYMQEKVSVVLIKKINKNQNIRLKKTPGVKKININLTPEQKKKLKAKDLEEKKNKKRRKALVVKNTAKNKKTRRKQKFFRKNIVVNKKKGFKKQITISRTKLIKIIKKQRIEKKKMLLKEKQFKVLLNATKNFYNYSVVNYKKKNLQALIGTKRRKKLKKAIRLIQLKFYKKYLNLKKSKNVLNIKSNNVLNGLFKSLSAFLPGVLCMKLVAKPFNNNVRKVMTKRQRMVLKTKLISLRRFKRAKFFKDGVCLMRNLVNQKNSAVFLSKFIAYHLKKHKRHNFFLKFIIIILKLFVNYKFLSIIKGIRIRVKGRVNGAPRTKQKEINIGKNMPIITISSKINYNEATCYTLNGTMSVKVWVYEKG